LAFAISTSFYSFRLLVLRRRSPGDVLWGRNGEELILIGASVAWVLIVAAETQKGYAGNPRYLVPAVAVFFAVGSVAIVRLAGSRIVLGLTRSPGATLVAVVAVCVVGTAAFSVHSLKSGVRLIQGRDHQVEAIRQELLTLRCPGKVYANSSNNAYLAQLTGRPLQDTVDWHLPYLWFKGNSFWFVYCAP
jgi:hypothetical protein